MRDGKLTVEARLEAPNFEAERRYVTMELGLARRELKKCAHWVPFSYPGLGILRRKDWQRYIQQLQRYSQELDRSGREMHEGLLPLVFSVENGHDQPMKGLKVQLSVVGGQIRTKHKPPVRPVRIDGAPNQSNAPALKRSWGFSRRRIRITGHSVEAELSRLEAHDNARLVSQTLYADVSRGARLHFVIAPKYGLAEEGEVRLPFHPVSSDSQLN